MEQKSHPSLLDLGYKAILDLLPCYLSIQDRSFNVLLTNQTFRNDFGDAVGRKCHEVYKKSAVRCSPCPVWETFQDKKSHTSEETVCISGGRTIQLIVHSTPVMDTMGNVVAAMELSTDISRVKELQRELTFLGQSVANLSHDIKNILEGLQGGSYVVDEAMKDQDPELLKKGWSVVKKNISEISRLVQNILYSSKKRQPAYEAVALEQMLMETVGFFYEKSQLLHCRLRARVNPSLAMIHMDPGAARRMLINLISNALEACSRDKEKASHAVSVRADYFDPHHFMVEVEDDGIGMDDSTAEKIFTRFFSTKGTDGTGLGLLVVHEIAKEHGGRIEVLSAPGKGSTFRVILPLNPPPPFYPSP